MKPLAMLMEKLLRAETVEWFLQNQCWISGTGRCCFKAWRRAIIVDVSRWLGSGLSLQRCWKGLFGNVLIVGLDFLYVV